MIIQNRKFKCRKQMIVTTLILVMGFIEAHQLSTASNLVQGYNKQTQLQCQNYQNNINILQGKIKTLKNQQNFYQCLKIQPVFHQFHREFNNLYFQTIYEEFLPFCEHEDAFLPQINKQTIKMFNQNRIIVEWALQRLSLGDHVLYDMQPKFNPLQIVMLSKIVGPSGTINIIGKYQNAQCFQKLKALHLLGNVRFLQNVNKFLYSSFLIVIAKKSSMLNQQLEKPVFDNKLILTYLYSNQTNIFQDLPEVSFNKINLANSTCHKLIHQTSRTQGFYQIFKEFKLSQAIHIQKRKHQPETKLLQNLSAKYSSFKQTLITQINQEIAQLSYISKNCKCLSTFNRKINNNYVYSIYGSKLFNVTIQQLTEWERHRESIEWIRKYSGSKTKMYYQLVGNNVFNNLLAIIQISKILLSNTQFYVFISSNQESLLKSLQFHIKQLSLGNIILLNRSSYDIARQSQIVITDNVQIITSLQSEGLLQSIRLLAFFTFRDKYSTQLLGRLYVNYHIRRVLIENRFNCYGFQLQHYFWSSNRPEGFYQIERSNYVIFSYWDGEPESIQGNRKFSLIQMIKVVEVQIKILNNLIVSYFSKQSYPMHKAFRLLTPMHRGDYLKAYLMYNYGGGYSDIKHMHMSWLPYFRMLELNKQVWAVGYGQISYYDISCHEQHDILIPCHQIRLKYKSLMGNGYFVFTKQSPMAKSWLQTVDKVLSHKYQQLKMNPFRVPRQANNFIMQLPNGNRFRSKYPFRWGQVDGQLYSRICYKYFGHFSLDMPRIIMQDYKN